MHDSPEDVLYASFEPSEAKLLNESSNSQLLAEFPILSSALSNIFPYLLLIDNFLEIVTWTNDDHYQNFLIIVLYSIVVIYWQFVSCAILPLLITISFSCIVWSTSSVIYDSKFNERPTIDEVLHTLHNITIRFEMLLRPVQHFNLKTKNFIKLFVMTSLSTPLHLFIIKTFLSPQEFLWLFGLFMLTYHSPWAFSARRLLWRSIYIRILAFYFTGQNIHLDRKEFSNKDSIEDSIEESDISLLSDFKILRKYVSPSKQIKQEVLIEILECERRWIGLGWVKFMLPNDRSQYCYANSLAPCEDINDFSFPVIKDDQFIYTWAWIDLKWSLDHEHNKEKDSNGWCYYDNAWANEGYKDGFSKYTRSRKWNRKAALTIEKILSQ